MFRKLLKYDMKAIWKYWWILAVTTLGVSVVGGAALKHLIAFAPEETQGAGVLITIVCSLLFFISVIGIAVAFYGTAILLLVRFYKNLFTDEAYLTFTLPVKRRQILLSKIVNAMFWTVVHGIVLIISAFVICVIAMPSSGGGFFNTEIISGISNAVSGFIDLVGAWVIVYFIEALLLILLYTLFFINLMHMCITIGSIIAKKHKVLASIGVYYACNIAFSVIIYVGMFVVMVASTGIVTAIESAPVNIIHLLISLLALIVCAIVASFASITYSVTQQLIDRKLNLA